MEPAPVDLRRKLVGVLADHPQFAGTLDLVWGQALRSFPGATLENWLGACRELALGPFGYACALAYIRNAPACAAIAGPEPGLALARTAMRIGLMAGSEAALAALSAAPKAARQLSASTAFREWLRVIEQVAQLAPESVAFLLDRTEVILADRDLRTYEGWVLTGIRAAGGDPERRVEFFRRHARGGTGPVSAGGNELVFSEIERRLRPYLAALWGQSPPIRSGVSAGGEAPRRAGFESGIIRVPETFRGYGRPQTVELFRASLAHIAAHFRFTRSKFPVGNLKPVQVALISLIEDARVEQLAIKDLLGLKRLWLPFHVAEPSGGLTAPILLARLARALLDPDYGDDNAWVEKGRHLFFSQREAWGDQMISRSIGGLLGNDLGQMRIQFNARTYIVEPPYRDDNLGIWDFGVAEPSTAEAATLFESVRFDRVEDDEPSQREGEGREKEQLPERPRHVKLTAAVDEEAGIPVARYPEWDYLIGRDRRDWATLVEFQARLGSTAWFGDVLESHSGLVSRISGLIRSVKVSRPVRLRRQPEGERLDLEASIAAAAARRSGEVPDPRVYMTLARRYRDLSALLLLDVSQSTNDVVRGSGTSVLSLERQAAALLANAMADLGDPFALHAFCSNGREDVRYYRIKDFDQPFDDLAKRRLAGLEGSLSTRIGAAIRHAGADLSQQRNHRRLLLVITDGEPSDIDIGDRKYLVEDARKAVMSLAHRGIDTFCVGLDGSGDNYFRHIFGRHNVVQVDKLSRLPEKLPLLYLRLTA